MKLTWAKFRRHYLGVHRSTAGRISHHLEKFGAGCFHVPQILAISPEVYRSIAPAVWGDAIDLDGGRVPVRRENAAASPPGSANSAGNSRSLNRCRPGRLLAAS